jgi:hypothetical protein
MRAYIACSWKKEVMIDSSLRRHSSGIREILSNHKKEREIFSRLKLIP